jgi:steroid delta-isomerase-like uncharacterized protein
MSTEHNKDIFRRIVAASNSGDMAQLRDVMYELVADDFVGHAPGEPDFLGPEGYLDFLMDFSSVVPDLQVDMLDLIAEDDLVVAQLLFRGTHAGELMGVPPTGREVSVPEVAICHMRDGELAELFVYWDNLEILRQLGVEIVPQNGEAEGASGGTP